MYVLVSFLFFLQIIFTLVSLLNKFKTSDPTCDGGVVYRHRRDVIIAITCLQGNEPKDQTRHQVQTTAPGRQQPGSMCAAVAWSCLAAKNERW